MERLSSFTKRRRKGSIAFLDLDNFTLQAPRLGILSLTHSNLTQELVPPNPRLSRSAHHPSQRDRRTSRLAELILAKQFLCCPYASTHVRGTALGVKQCLSNKHNSKKKHHSCLQIGGYQKLYSFTHPSNRAESIKLSYCTTHSFLRRRQKGRKQNTLYTSIHDHKHHDPSTQVPRLGTPQTCGHPPVPGRIAGRQTGDNLNMVPGEG